MLRKFLNHLKYRAEFIRKCPETKPCHCCSFWHTRKGTCRLENELKVKYGLERKKLWD